ncbi:hypothetical protein HH800_00800 [Sphingobium yanoikuyae]|jgi:hypothetical protein|uniref:Uncharacterized protein n=1 Tax=Sphingobium yanoikuyae TaxID=13690 RepID=A0A6M4G1B0_SPHYA|nr:hypothetical protein [Sphingobium yanoikuyae]QJR00859.1 hypothetical protein HH800_00800 [Sphingobium yanoikuyae]
MRQPVRQSGGGNLRAARPTPSYNDEVTKDFIERQDARIREAAGDIELVPISGDAW